MEGYGQASVLDGRFLQGEEHHFCALHSGSYEAISATALMQLHSRSPTPEEGSLKAHPLTYVYI